MANNHRPFEDVLGVGHSGGLASMVRASCLGGLLLFLFSGESNPFDGIGWDLLECKERRISFFFTSHAFPPPSVKV